MMLIGYARVSTQDQTLRLQHDALIDGGCEKLFREKLSGTSTTLPAREKLLCLTQLDDGLFCTKSLPCHLLPPS